MIFLVGNAFTGLVWVMDTRWFWLWIWLWMMNSNLISVYDNLCFLYEDESDSQNVSNFGYYCTQARLER